MISFLVLVFIISAPALTLLASWLVAHGDSRLRECWAGFSAALSVFLANIVWQHIRFGGGVDGVIQKLAFVQYGLAALFVLNWLFHAYRPAAYSHRL